jgi:NADPH-dependent 2,4-dienoyl-CoA reductase/sulfur reductase-like enzyme
VTAISTGQAARLVDDVNRANGGRSASASRSPVDALLMSAGWTPSLHLFSQSRGKVAFDAPDRRFLPGPTRRIASRRRVQRHGRWLSRRQVEGRRERP